MAHSGKICSGLSSAGWKCHTYSFWGIPCSRLQCHSNNLFVRLMRYWLFDKLVSRSGVGDSVICGIAYRDLRLPYRIEQVNLLYSRILEGGTNSVASVASLTCVGCSCR